MIAYTKARVKHLLKIEFIRFCIVGGTGFVLNLVILKVLEHAGLSVWVAQPISAEIALGSNFILHHNWTYKQNKVKKSVATLLIQFHATTWPAIIGSTIMVGFGEKSIHLSNVNALALSSLITLLWNFFWSKYVIWRGVTTKEIEDLA